MSDDSPADTENGRAPDDGHEPDAPDGHPADNPTAPDASRTAADPDRHVAADPDADANAGESDADARTATDATDAVFDDLFATIEDRKRDLPDDSYTASLFTHEKGIDAVLEKLGEESTELTLAAKDDDSEAIRHESADLVYHLFVLLAARDLTLEDLRAELRDRFG